MVLNHIQRYRPLRGGIMMLVEGVNELGTIGATATSNGQDRWALTACHIVTPAGLLPIDGRRVFQPDATTPQNAIGTTIGAKSDPRLDVAAVLIDTGIAAVGEILGLPLAGPAGAAVPGMRVVKAGRKTGVTEGEVTQVSRDRIVIEPPQRFPVFYELSERGDSGAIWVEKNSGVPIGLHRQGSTTGAEFAVATPLLTALAQFGLRLLLPS